MGRFMAGAGTGAVIGGVLGKSVGIALMGTAISGLWPLAGIGAVIGGLGVLAARR